MGASVMLNARAISSGDTVTSDAVKLEDGLVHHALGYLVEGSGVVRLDVLVSIDGRNFINQGKALAGAKSSSGPGGDGHGYVPLVLLPGEFIKVSAIVSTDAVTLTVWFVQK